MSFSGVTPSSFFDITYSSLKNRAEAELFNPRKNTRIEEKNLENNGENHHYLPGLEAHRKELVQMTFEAKMQVLIAYMNRQDAHILMDKITDNDAAFLAEVFMGTNDLAIKYQKIIEEARKRLPGYIDCQLSERIHTAITGLFSTSIFSSKE